MRAAAEWQARIDAWAASGKSGGAGAGVASMGPRMRGDADLETDPESLRADADPAQVRGAFHLHRADDSQHKARDLNGTRGGESKPRSEREVLRPALAP